MGATTGPTAIGLIVDDRITDTDGGGDMSNAACGRRLLGRLLLSLFSWSEGIRQFFAKKPFHPLEPAKIRLY
jgi:hypothetical protein